MEREIATRRMKKNNGGNGDFLLGSLDANIKTVLVAVQEIKQRHDMAVEKMDLHQKDDNDRFDRLGKYIWIVCGMGILLTFLVGAASLVIQIRKGDSASASYEIRRETEIQRPAKEQAK